MIAGQPDIRARIEQLKLSENGYRRQLTLLNISPERRERLEIDVRLLDEEIAALEKLAQLRRVEPDPEKVEAAVRERLAAVRARMSADPSMARLTEEERDLTSGEVRGLQWALGEDPITQKMRELMPARDPSGSGGADRALPSILINNLQQGPDPESRASAAYELGKLKLAQAIPALASALEDDPLVAEIALKALSSFSEPELRQAGLPEDLIARALLGSP